MLDHRIPGSRRVPHSEHRPRISIETTRGQELPRDLGLRRCELLGEELGGRTVQRHKSGSLSGIALQSRCSLDVAQRHPCAPGEFLDRLSEGQVVDLGEKTDDIAAFLATEAVEHSLARGDVERR